MQILPEQIRELLDTFKAVNPDANALKAYCERHKIDVLVPSQFEDFKFADDQDKMTEVVFYKTMEILSKLVYIPDYISHAEKTRLAEQNEELEYLVIGESYKVGITYRNADMVMSTIMSFLEAILKNIKNRNGNMGANALKSLAIDKFGTEDFTLKMLSDYLNVRAGNTIVEDDVASTEAKPAEEKEAE